MTATEAIARGYSGGHVWCLRCDVGWIGFERTCWLCEQDDKVWRWGWKNVHPFFGPVKEVA